MWPSCIYSFFPITTPNSLVVPSVELCTCPRCKHTTYLVSSYYASAHRSFLHYPLHCDRPLRYRLRCAFLGVRFLHGRRASPTLPTQRDDGTDQQFVWLLPIPRSRPLSFQPLHCTRSPFLPPFPRVSTIFLHDYRACISWRPSQSSFLRANIVFATPTCSTATFVILSTVPLRCGLTSPHSATNRYKATYFYACFSIWLFPSFSTTFHFHLIPYSSCPFPNAPFYPLSILYPSSRTLSFSLSHPPTFAPKPILRTITSAVSTFPSFLFFNFSYFPAANPFHSYTSIPFPYVHSLSICTFPSYPSSASSHLWPLLTQFHNVGHHFTLSASSNLPTPTRLTSNMAA